ncbi:PREDICTED: PRUPE_3G251300 [Prunus dulcis]|uniref:PREDICTED: PRUPE_3G251300 n=1 Tax=Prunus dulcis TaxID=3755 RepID=A0A5E4EUP3_PRUDU|nr:PREDICTED: PRUPE_3G251300 [Prunus dulcis]
MGSSVVVGVFVIMLTTAMMSQLPSTSHCLMNKSSSSTSSSSSNWCINGSTHQYCQQLTIPQDKEEGFEDLELEFMNMIMKHMPVDDSHHETSNRMLPSMNPTSYNVLLNGPAFKCGRNGYGPCIPNPTENKRGMQCKSPYDRACIR